MHTRPYSLLLLFLLLAINCSGPESESRPDPVAVPDTISADLLITGARVIDGTGEPDAEADVWIRNGRIAGLAEPGRQPVRARQTIEANGRVLSPGFIDMHAHGSPLRTPEFDNFLHMGVTTISLGQDGSGPGVSDTADWMQEVEREGIGPNLVHFIGHGSLRIAAGIPDGAPATAEERNRMQEMLFASLEAGSFGMSTGLEYTPGRFSDLEELVSLAEILAERDALLTSHMRSEDADGMEEALGELLLQGARSGARVHVSHIKLVLGNDPAQAERILEHLEESRQSGIQVTADIYPYTASFTGISLLFPDWALSPNDYDEVVRTRRDELATYLRERVLSRNGPEATLIGTAPWAGQTLAEIANETGRPFEEVLIDMGPGGASAAYFVMNEEVMRTFMQDPHVMISSDGSPTMRHPRGYGSFAKVIETITLEEDLFPLEEAIRKMTGLPASVLGLDDPNQVATPRGLIREGYAADLLLFHPEQIRETTRFDEPHQLAEGFDWVIVNGNPVIEEGEPVSGRPGEVLRRTDCSSP
ncbi:MAG: N-acyl-D-amino-acid deacylase family protein [Bacteroidota bacterium]